MEKYVPTVEGDHDRGGRSRPWREIPTVEGDPERGGIPRREAARDPDTRGISRYGRDLPTREGSPNTGGTYFPYGKSNDLKYYHYFMFLYA